MFDLSLDTLKKNGHTTLLDSLWAGIPTVVFDGGGGVLEARAALGAAEKLSGGAVDSDRGASGGIIVYGRKDYEAQSLLFLSDGLLRSGARQVLHSHNERRGGVFDTAFFAKEFLGLLEGMRRVGRRKKTHHLIGGETLVAEGGDVPIPIESRLESLEYHSEVKLNIGGIVQSEGWTIVNALDDVFVDEVAMMHDLGMFGDNSVDVIYAR